MKKKIFYLFILFSFKLYSNECDTLKINFNLFFKSEKFINDVSCKKTKENFKISSLKFYASNFKIYYEDDSSDLLSVIHLFDIENKESFTAKLTINEFKKVKSIIFTIGLDSLTTKTTNLENDLDPINGMFWSWRAGYINYKIEGSFGKSNNLKDFVFHIGGNTSDLSSIFTVYNEFNNNNNKFIDINIELKHIIDFLNYSKINNIMSINDDSFAFSNFFKKCFL